MGGDLNALTGVTAGLTRGTTTIDSTNSSNPIATKTVASTANGWLCIMTEITPTARWLSGLSVLKAGDKISYTAGYKVFATSTTTTPTASASGSGIYTLVDGATALSVSAGVAAAIAMIAF